MTGRALLALASVALALVFVSASVATTRTPGTPSPSDKLRSDLAAMVTGEQAQDPGVGRLVQGYRPGELAYFAVLSEPNDAAHQAAVTSLGARVLRAYRSVNAFALASDPTTVLRVAALPWVSWLAPVELVRPAAEHEVDQSRATTADVGAPAWWDRGVIGAGVTVAVLDTGLDPTHPDLDDLDFRHWSNPVNPPKVVDARNFVGGGCLPAGTADGHGHGTHVAGIAAGTGEGTPLADDNGKYAGIAPGAKLAVAKVLADAGTGLNSDLVAAMEWAAMPAAPGSCSIGADIVNISLGSEARPTRLNSDADVDFVGYTLDHLAVRYGTLFVGAAGNSGPFIGSALEAPGSAAQVLSVAATAKDYDLNHDDTLSGDTCAGWRHPRSTSQSDNDCRAGVGDQPPSISSFSSRGPSGDVWLRPDIAAPGYNIVSAQSATGTAIGPNDINRGTRADPLYATATGTSMATPATAGSAALVLDAYRQAYAGQSPSGSSGVTGLRAPSYVLLRAALMNSAGPDLFESRWILTTDASTRLECPAELAPLMPFCEFATQIEDAVANGLGSLTLYEVRNGAADPYVGPLAEGAGKLNIQRAIAAVRDGIVAYSAASGSGADAGTGHRDFQGSWQVGTLAAGTARSQRFVLHGAPSASAATVTFAFAQGHPSDGSGALPSSWVTLPGSVTVPRGGDVFADFRLTVPANAQAGTYTGAVVATTSRGQVLRIPVFAAVPLHDPDPAQGNAPGPQARITSAHDVFGKDDTTWPSVAGTAPTGTNADWLVYPVDLASGLSEARFSVYDSAAGDETYDLYLYDAHLDLVASSHPFAAPGVTDEAANATRGPSTEASPQVLSLRTPAQGRHYLVASRAKIGGTTSGDFGSFALKLDEIRVLPPPTERLATQLDYDGDFLFTQGAAGRLSAQLTDAAGAPIAGRTVSFVFDGSASPCPGGCSATTDYRGEAQIATDPIALTPGIHEVTASFAGDDFWLPSSTSAFVLVVGSGLPGPGGHVTAGGWFVPDGRSGSGNAVRVHFAFQADGSAAPSGDLRYRDPAAAIDVTRVSYAALTVNGNEASLTGTVRYADGHTGTFTLNARDVGEPGNGHDTIRLRLPDSGYDQAGTLGGGNIQIHTR
jgi:subtilisin family serine protease